MKKKFLVVATSFALCVGAMTGCASFKRDMGDIKSDFCNGLNRTVTVYTADGKKIAEYKGKIDLAESDGYVKFDFKGKRYVYYNCFVESIADL